MKTRHLLLPLLSVVPKRAQWGGEPIFEGEERCKPLGKGDHSGARCTVYLG